MVLSEVYTAYIDSLVPAQWGGQVQDMPSRNFEKGGGEGFRIWSLDWIGGVEMFERWEIVGN